MEERQARREYEEEGVNKYRLTLRKMEDTAN
jgi:hypothetical protein